MTLLQLIERHEERACQPAPIDRETAALTPRGDAALALYRFLRVLRALGDEDRHYVLGMMAEELVPTRV